MTILTFWTNNLVFAKPGLPSFSLSWEKPISGEAISITVKKLLVGVKEGKVLCWMSNKMFWQNTNKFAHNCQKIELDSGFFGSEVGVAHILKIKLWFEPKTGYGWTPFIWCSITNLWLLCCYLVGKFQIVCCHSKPNMFNQNEVVSAVDGATGPGW